MKREYYLHGEEPVHYHLPGEEPDRDEGMQGITGIIVSVLLSGALTLLVWFVRWLLAI